MDREDYTITISSPGVTFRTASNGAVISADGRSVTWTGQIAFMGNLNINLTFWPDGAGTTSVSAVAHQSSRSANINVVDHIATGFAVYKALQSARAGGFTGEFGTVANALSMLQTGIILPNGQTIQMDTAGIPFGFAGSPLAYPGAWVGYLKDTPSGGITVLTEGMPLAISRTANIPNPQYNPQAPELMESIPAYIEYQDWGYGSTSGQGTVQVIQAPMVYDRDAKMFYYMGQNGRQYVAWASLNAADIVWQTNPGYDPQSIYGQETIPNPISDVAVFAPGMLPWGVDSNYQLTAPNSPDPQAVQFGTDYRWRQ